MYTKEHLTQFDVIGDICNLQEPFSPCKTQNDKVSMKDWQTHLCCYNCEQITSVMKVREKLGNICQRGKI